MGNRYTREEAEEILRRALQAGARAETEEGDAILHEDLLEAAAEVGVSREALDAAVSQVSDERERIALEDAVLLRRQRAFGRSVLRTLVFGGGLVAMNLLLHLRLTFLPWLGFGFGVWLMMRGWRAYFPSEDNLARAIKDERKRRDRQAARERKRRRAEADEQQKRLRAARAKEQLERVVENGLEVLLSAAADTLEDLAKERTSPVAGPRVRVAPDPARSSGASGAAPADSHGAETDETEARGAHIDGARK